MLRQIEVILAQLDEETKAWERTEITSAFVNDQAALAVSAGALVEADRRIVFVSQNNCNVHLKIIGNDLNRY